MKCMEKEESCSVWSLLAQPCNPCGTFPYMEIMLNSFMLWLLPKCRSFKRDRNTAASHVAVEKASRAPELALCGFYPFLELGPTSFPPRSN